jgi:hypothetical protein
MKFCQFLIVTCVLIGAAFADESLQECFQKDSISCLQLMVFRKAKSLFDQQNIDLVGGLSLVKSEEQRQGKSFSDNSAEVEAANDVDARENALESFMFENARNFFEERSLKLNIAGAARSLSTIIPDEVKANVRSLVVEGRGKKKILKKLMPLLGLLKLKLAGLAIILLFGIGLIAKKAILVSLISIAISGFLAIKKLLSKKGGGGGEHIEAVPYHGGGGGGGWSSGGGGGAGWNSYEPSHGGFGEYGSHSQPVGQSIAYSGHHKVARR